MNEHRWDPAKMGPLLAPAFAVLVGALEPVDTASRSEVRALVLAQSEIQPKTFDSLLRDLANFGLIIRLGAKHDRLRLTTLGRQWLETTT